MTIENFTPWTSLSGGLLIGLAAVLLLLFNGKIAGISGITKGLFSSEANEVFWRLAFIAGLILGGWGFVAFFAEMTAAPLELPLPQMVFAGLLVGFGTAIGRGCTSGHGVCGLGRRSPRSVLAVLSFMLSGFISMWLLTQFWGGRF